jgi:hypothetical protein
MLQNLHLIKNIFYNAHQNNSVLSGIDRNMVQEKKEANHETHKTQIIHWWNHNK